MIKYLPGILLIVTVIVFPQSKNLTKGADNGFAWNSMVNPLALFDDSRYNYLSRILEQFSVLNQYYPDAEKFGCSEEINDLQIRGKSDEISLDDMVIAIDKFYSNIENRKIPIIFTYCYCIKQKAGLSKKELNDYRNELLKFSEED